MPAPAPTATRAAAPDTPYKGLTPYVEADAPFFFGRQLWSEILTDNLKAYRLTLLYGESGVGKSSLLRAGVEHRLREQGERDRAERGKPGMAVIVFSDWRQDAEAALVTLLDAIEPHAGTGNGHSGRTEATLEAAIERCGERVGGRVFLVLDQFEEYFVYHPGGDEDEPFANALPRALARTDLRLSIAISIREDALARLDRFKGRIPNLFDNYVRLEHLDRAGATDAIECPLERFTSLRPGAGPTRIGPGLIELILHDVEAGKLDVGPTGGGRVGGSAGEVETPYLQLVLTRLWQVEAQAGSDVMRVETLRALGGAQGIVSSHLAAAMQSLSDPARDVAARAFRYLVTRSRTKIAHSVTDLAEWTEVPEAELAPVLERLSHSDARILRPVGEDSYEIYHDVLAEAVLTWRSAHDAERRVAEEKRVSDAAHRRRLARLGAIVGGLAFTAVLALALVAYSERNDAQAQRKLALSRELATSSRSAGETDPDLGLLLAREAWSESHTGEALTALRTSVERSGGKWPLAGGEKVRYAEYSADGTRILTSIVGGGGSLWDAASRRRIATYPSAVERRFSPDGKRIITVDSQRRVAVWEPVRGARLDVVAPSVRSVGYPEIDAHGTLLATVSGRVGQVIELSSGRVVRTIRARHEILELTMAARGRLLATDRTGVTYLWGARGARPIAPLATDYGLLRVSPDGTRALFGSGRTLSLVDLASGRRIARLESALAIDSDSVFSTDGRRFATLDDQRVVVWSAGSGRRLASLRSAGSTSIQDFAGTDRVLLAGSNGTLRLWRTRTDATSLIGRAGRGFKIGRAGRGFKRAFLSPDGRHVLVVASGTAPAVWPVTGGRDGLPLAAGAARRSRASFDPAGEVIATAGTRGRVRLWDTLSGQQLRELRTGRRTAVTATFDRAGERLLTANRDGTAALWEVATGRRLATMRRSSVALAPAVFSPDGTLIATAGEDGEIALWRTGASTPLKTFDGRSRVLSVAFRRDSARLVTAHADHAARIWDVRAGTGPRVLRPGRIHKLNEGTFVPNAGATFSPDGGRVLMLGADGSMRLWDGRGRLVAEVALKRGMAINGADFSPHGDTIAVGTDDSVVRLYDGHTAAVRRTLRAFSEVAQASFSRDGRWIVASDAGNATVWNVADGQRVAIFRSRASLVPSVAFDPTGQRIVALDDGSEGGAAHVYTCLVCASSAELVASARRSTGRELTQGERKRYLHEAGA